MRWPVSCSTTFCWCGPTDHRSFKDHGVDFVVAIEGAGIGKLVTAWWSP